MKKVIVAALLGASPMAAPAFRTVGQSGRSMTSMWVTAGARAARFRLANGLLTCGLTLATWAAGTGAAAATGEVDFDFDAKSQIKSAIYLCIDETGGPWILALDREDDVKGLPIVLTLRLSKDWQDENAFYNGLNLHGFQPFAFTATSPAGAGELGPYGPIRELHVARPKLRIDAVVTAVSILRQDNQPYFRAMSLILIIKPDRGASFHCAAEGR